MNSDLIDPDDLRCRFGQVSTVLGGAERLEKDIAENDPIGAVLCAGSCVGRSVASGLMPDFVVTDLDGDIEPQLEASRRGAITFIHAHGDNTDLVMKYAGRFEGPVVLTTQSRPENTVFDFGGFTDGDRAVCIAQEMGSDSVLLLGFDFYAPGPKNGTDPSVKSRKLRWAERIIDSLEIRIIRLTSRIVPLKHL